MPRRQGPKNIFTYKRCPYRYQHSPAILVVVVEALPEKNLSKEGKKFPLPPDWIKKNR
jgi:hypothetical protein